MPLRVTFPTADPQEVSDAGSSIEHMVGAVGCVFERGGPLTDRDGTGQPPAAGTSPPPSIRARPPSLPPGSGATGHGVPTLCSQGYDSRGDDQALTAIPAALRPPRIRRAGRAAPRFEGSGRPTQAARGQRALTASLARRVRHSGRNRLLLAPYCVPGFAIHESCSCWSGPGSPRPRPGSATIGPAEFLGRSDSLAHRGRKLANLVCWRRTRLRVRQYVKMRRGNPWPGDVAPRSGAHA